MVSNFLHPQNLLPCYISIHLSLLKIDTHLSYFSTTDMSVILSLDKLSNFELQRSKFC